MNNFIQEIHLDMLAWGSLEDQIDKRAVAEIVGTPTKKKEKEEEKKFSSSKKTPANRNKKTLNQLLQQGSSKTPKSGKKGKEQKAWEKNLAQKWKDKIENRMETDESPRQNSMKGQLVIPLVQQEAVFDAKGNLLDTGDKTMVMHPSPKARPSLNIAIEGNEKVMVWDVRNLLAQKENAHNNTFKRSNSCDRLETHNELGDSSSS